MASPVFFIKKKDGTLWLVQDYWALNAMTVKNKYLFPLISELINKLRGAKYFTKLDVRWGFNNVWSVLEYLKEFDSIFSKESFNALPESKKWDHAVELIPGEKASNCKVYPLALTEQKELDKLLKEKWEMGQIHPSKSPMASPVFSLRRRMVLYGLFRTIRP